MRLGGSCAAVLTMMVEEARVKPSLIDTDKELPKEHSELIDTLET